MNDGEQACLVAVPRTSCEVDELVNGREYRFRVRALSGAGWGEWSSYSDIVIPRREATIMITGARDGRRVQVAGMTTGLVGETVTPWVRLAGQSRYRVGEGTRTVDAQGTFTWDRVTGKKTYVYFRAGDDVRSTRVVIPARQR